MRQQLSCAFHMDKPIKFQVPRAVLVIERKQYGRRSGKVLSEKVLKAQTASQTTGDVEPGSVLTSC